MKLLRSSAFTVLMTLSCIGMTGAVSAAPPEWDGFDPGSADARADKTDDLGIPDLTPAMGEDALPQVSAEQLQPRPLAIATPHKKTRKSQEKDLKKHRAEAEPAASSRLEDAYAERLAAPLEQFGYTLFGQKNDENNVRTGIPAGAAQDDFIVSAGDRLDITFRGQRSTHSIYAVDSQGQLLVEDLPPLPAAGRTIAQLRKTLEAEAGKQPNTEVFVSLDAVRQIDVLVVGHVRAPGRQTLTVFHTALDALEHAGGIDKTGSLRQVRLVRNGHTTAIDLYDILAAGGTGADFSLRDGDRIIVPPIGATVALAGGLKRPGIYELPGGLSGSRPLSLKEMLDLGGGLLAPGQVRYMRMSLTADGEEKVQEVTGFSSVSFGDGDILSAEPAKEKRTGTVELKGEARQQGVHALDNASTLSSLLGSDQVFGPDIYPLIGLIERQDNQELTKQIIAFPPLQVIKGTYDNALQDGDMITLFSRRQIMALQAPDAENPVKKTVEAPPENGIIDPAVSAYLKERSVYVRGAVRQPGAWPVADGATLDNVIAAAGGMTLEANPQNIEVTTALPGPEKNGDGTRRIVIDSTATSPGTITVSPGDAVRVNQKQRKLAENTALIAGQVLHPGRYDLLPGDRLSDLLKRAGGLTPQAYPQGAIFSRDSERRAEEQRYRAQARSLETRLASSMNDKGDKAPDTAQIAAVQQLIGQLEEAQGVGRITVESDPGTLAADPAVDILLEAGDRVYIPQRPLTVRVAGEVLSPSNLQFRKDKDPENYISEAGGFTYNADKDRAFVVYPDGSAQPLQVSLWSHNAAMIPPGSTIVVPRDPKPFDFLETARDVTQILSNLAVTGIFVDNIQDN